jgi:Tfp pilus assembly protein PilO
LRMITSFRSNAAQRSPRFWLQVGAGILALLNAIALFLYLAPPGGSRQELMAESQRLEGAKNAARLQSVKLKTVSEKVQLGGEQSVTFESRYILPKRLAYETVLAEIQRMAQGASLTQREGALSEDPIEGTDDLSILNVTTNFEGSYPNLMRFLYEVDRSPMLLMLDSLTATPQRAGQITAQARFQAVIRDQVNPTTEGPQ